MPELIGEEHIDWDNFEVTDPDAPEYRGERAEDPEADQGTPDEPVGDGVDEPIATEDTSQPASPPEQEPGEEPVAAQEPVASSDPLLDAYLAKYGGDMEKAVRAAAHQDDLIGRQGAELGEMRQTMAELLEAVNRPAAPSLDNLDAVFAENPAAAADRALEAGFRSGDYAAHHEVIRQWREIDPAQVYLYEQNKKLEARLVEANQRVESLPSQLQQPQQEQQALASAEARLRAEFPDLDLKALEPAMMEEANEAYRVFGEDGSYAQYLKSGDPEKTYYGLRTLAMTALNRKSADTRQRIAENARTAAVETQRAKLDAMVTTGASTGAEPPPEKSYDDELLDRMKAEDNRNSGFRIGNY